MSSVTLHSPFKVSKFHRQLPLFPLSRSSNQNVVVSCLASHTGGVKYSWKIDYEATRNILSAGDVVVSCLASRTGGMKYSWKIDYEATRNSLAADRNHGASHFVLLSAICVQKPLLEFQRAKAEI
ncbi:hypothetical protein Pint_17798 [Pistacia integerrima]|uniref:Uncharacterized protein n=1 Tax=Pistacia integerrima TaxID=434235 RepID=A0ACC0YXV0_9ROSI|nr:hypothetical protein Pint_17798 [Pistacia integerrima]